jgi:hypothetical protein
VIISGSFWCREARISLTTLRSQLTCTHHTSTLTE